MAIALSRKASMLRAEGIYPLDECPIAKRKACGIAPLLATQERHLLPCSNLIAICIKSVKADRGSLFCQFQHRSEEACSKGFSSQYRATLLRDNG
jgi:hypothetical protein